MKQTRITFILILAGLFAFSSALFAADGKGKGKGKGKGNPIVAKLGLDDDQKKQFMTLQKETAAKRKEAGKDREAQKKIMQAHQAKLKEILNEDQIKKYRELQAEMRKNRGGKGGKGSKGGKGKGKGKGKNKE